MADPATALGWALLVFALIGVAYTFGAGAAVEWFFSQSPAPQGGLSPVTVLKPLHGDEPGLKECLEGFCRQDYPAPVQIVFGVRDACDAAIPIVQALTRDYPDSDIELVVDGRLHGGNYKISNLVNMEAFIRHPVVVLADSDVSVRPDYLRLVSAALADPAMGFVSCVCVGRPTGNFWARLTAMSMDHHFLPSVAFGLQLKMAKPCFGPTIALRRTTLAEIGGFRPFVDHLADDFEIGRRIRALGYRFSIPPMTIQHGCPERSARSLFLHEIRWARTIRLIDPAAYAGSAVCHPLPWALIAAVLLRGAPASLATLGLVMSARLFVVRQVDRLAGGQSTQGWLSPVRDLLSAAVWLAAFTANSVSWRGRRFRIGPGGVLMPHQPVQGLPKAETPGWTSAPAAAVAAAMATGVADTSDRLV